MRRPFLPLLFLLAMHPALGFSQDLKTGDALILNRESVFIYTRPGGPDDGEVTRQDLRSNGDRIVFKEARTYKGETWYRVIITTPAKGKYAMPNTNGWFKASDVTGAASSAPYGRPAPPLERLRKTMGVSRVVESGPTVTVFLQRGFCSSLGSSCDPILRSHTNTVWENRPKTGIVLIVEDGGTRLSESSRAGHITIF
jgi:hypothetical protein